MLPIRRSTASDENPNFVNEEPVPGESNIAWLARARADMPELAVSGAVILLGGSTLADFRVRLAQSHVRDDLTPSYWSLVGVLDGDTVLTAPLWPLRPPEDVPARNAIMRLPIDHFGNPEAWPNIGVALFQWPTRTTPVESVIKLCGQRPVVDLPALLLHWLGFVWGAGAGTNPLLGGFGIPSAVMVETAFGLAEVELTPGLASSSSCPEAIYQAAKWWHEFYAGAAGKRRNASRSWPAGRYTMRQPQATYRDPDPEPL